MIMLTIITTQAIEEKHDWRLKRYNDLKNNKIFKIDKVDKHTELIIIMVITMIMIILVHNER